MEPIDTLVAGLKHVDALIAEDVMEPDLTRGDWSGMRARAKLLYDAVHSDVLSALDDALFSVGGDEVAMLIKRRVANVVGEAAAPVFATGDTKGFLSLVSKASQVAADDEQRETLDAGSAEPETFVRIQHARWLQKRGEFKKADAVLKRAASMTEKPALKRAIKSARNAPRPITSAPSLFRVNGCGTGLYGERDRRPDGSYIATYCICLLFIPVFPLTAYRVKKIDDRTYQFSAKEVLSSFARGFQLLVLAGIVLAVAVNGVTSYLESPARRAEVAMKEANAAEASGDHEGAVQRFKDVVRSWEGTIDVAPAAEAVVRLTSASVAEPAKAASVDQISRVVNGFYELSASARRGAPCDLLVSKMCAWSDQIGDAKPDDASASLAILDMAAKLGKEGGDVPKDVEDRRSKMRRSIADKAATERPLLALANYAKIADAQAIDAAKAIIGTFGTVPSLWLEAEPDVDRYADGAAKLGRNEDASTARAKLKDAAAAHAEDKAVIDGGDEKAIAKALAARPGDQELAVALAGMKRERGDVKAAVSTLTGLGAPGRLTGDAQRLLGQCYADLGDLEKADQVLSAFMGERLPPFQDAQREYFSASNKLRDSIVRDAKLGIVPREIEDQLKNASDDEQVSIFGDYLRSRLDSDPEVSALRMEYLRHSAVVPASLTLGMVKLRRARESSGDAQRALLGEAERAFLAIRQEAEGEPSFHLGLGQVYHRLGRAEDGDKELQGVLDRKDDTLSLAVSNVYRELGHVVRARQVAEQVYKDGKTEQMKQSAAFLRAHMYDGLEDQETWLKRSDTSSPTVKNMLTENEAGRLAEAGKLAEADRAYAKVIAFHERDAKSDPAAANNAAVVYMTRYTLTGDIANIKSAVTYLETSVRLSGDNAITIGHLSDALEYLGLTTVASKWVQTKTLMLDSGSAISLFDTLLEGPARADILDALSKEPSYRRALDLTKQEQILAPQKVSAYLKQLRFLRWSRDTAGLADLDKRLAAMPPMNSEDAAEGRRQFAAGEKDDELKRSSTEQVARARERLARAQKEGNKPTVAVAYLALADALGMMLYWDDGSASMDERVSVCRSAREAWPEGVPESELSGTLMVTGVVKAAAANEGLGKLFAAERRRFNVTNILVHAFAAKGSEEVLAALRAQPELQESAKMRKAAISDRPSMGDWVLARAVGDAELEQAASKSFEREDLKLDLQISAKLFPGQEREKADLDLYTSKGHPAP